MLLDTVSSEQLVNDQKVVESHPIVCPRSFTFIRARCRITRFEEGHSDSVSNIWYRDWFRVLGSDANR